HVAPELSQRHSHDRTLFFSWVTVSRAPIWPRIRFRPSLTVHLPRDGELDQHRDRPAWYRPARKRKRSTACFVALANCSCEASMTRTVDGSTLPSEVMTNCTTTCPPIPASCSMRG